MSQKLNNPKMKKFTTQQLSDHIFHMGTATLECCIANNLRTEDVKVFKSKTIGVYYLVGAEKNEKGLPAKVYFKKDFR